MHDLGLWCNIALFTCIRCLNSNISAYIFKLYSLKYYKYLVTQSFIKLRKYIFKTYISLQLISPTNDKL